MVDIRFIAVDLDGTLLNDDHMLSPYTRAVWQELLDRNIYVVPATGRPFQALRNAIPVELCDYVVSTNGVHIYKKEHDVFLPIWNKSMDWNIFKSILDLKEHHAANMHMHCYVDNSLYARTASKELDEYSARVNIDVVMVDTWEELANKKISKVMFIADNAYLVSLSEKFSQLHGVVATFSMINYLELFSNQASKALALQYIMDDYKIHADHALAIGDSFNDLPMFEICKYKYIMKNATPMLAPELPRTEFTNNEDGVARLLQKLFSL